MNQADLRVVQTNFAAAERQLRQRQQQLAEVGSGPPGFCSDIPSTTRPQQDLWLHNFAAVALLPVDYSAAAAVLPVNYALLEKFKRVH